MKSDVPIPEKDDTEQYIKDIRTINSDEHAEQDEQSGKNDFAQEENKKSQKNAETDAPYGD